MPQATSPKTGSPLPQGELLKRFSVLVLLSAGARALGLAAVILMARGLGVELFGEVGFAQAVIGYGATFATFGLAIYGVRQAVRDPNSIGTVAGTIMVIRIALACIAYVAFLALSLLPAFRPVAGLIALFGLTLFARAISVFWIAQAKQRTDVIGLSSLIRQLLFLGGIYFAFQQGFGKYAVPMALVTAELVVGLGAIAWVRARVCRIELHLDMAVCRRVIKQAAPVAGSQMLRALAIGSDLVLLGLLVTMNQVGVYAAAFKIFMLGFTLVGLYILVVLPHLVHHGSVSVRQLSSEVGSLLWKLMALAVPLAVVGAASAPWMIELAFGAEYAGATTPMRLLILATLALLVAGHYRPAILALGEHRRDLGNVGASSAVHLGLKLLLIPFFGLAGAAAGTLIGEVTLALTSWLTLRRLVVAERQVVLSAEDVEDGSLSGGGLSNRLNTE